MEKKPIMGNKMFLYMTEFFAGMSVMAVELGASRLLAPYFSSSQIVWTIIIGTIMIAMALGNIYGGYKADKDPDPSKLYGRIMIAAVWIALIPVVGKYLILGISGVLIFAINSNFLVVAAFASCMIVFVFPLFLLGTVTPSLAKYTTESLEDNGRIIGRLGAFNTIGSIIGTFLPTFVTIPAVGTSVTFFIFAGILILLSVVYFISTSKKIAVKTATGIIIFVLCCFFGGNKSFAFWENDLTYEGESVYNYLQVKEDDETVILSTNVLFGVQSIYIKDGSLSGMYYDYAMAAPFMAGINESDETDVLILGMGTGTYATQLERYFDNINIEGVEIDDKITDLAHTYFYLPEDLSVTTYDGRAYLGGTDKKYDVIMVDAYQDITIPFQMSSVEFFTMVKDHLKEDGVMVVNMNMYSGELDPENPSINTYLADTIASVFGNVVTVKVPNYTNTELFATDNDDFIARMTDNAGLEKEENLKNIIAIVADKYEIYNGGDNIMTDDRAPVELLGMRQIDLIIKDEVDYYKFIYNTKGLDGLIDSFM